MPTAPRPTRVRVISAVVGWAVILSAAGLGGRALFDTLRRTHGLPSAAATPATAPIVVPFELRNGFALLPVAINGHPMILDTGSGVSVLDSAFAQSAGVDLSGQRVLVNGGPSTAALGTARTVRLASAQLSNMIVVATTAFADVQDRIGHDVHGSIGFDLFDNYVAAVDYRARTLTLFDAKSFTYTGSGAVLPLRVDHRVPLVDARIVTRKSGPLDARLGLDLGSASLALRLAAPFVAAHDLEHDTVAVTGPFGAEVGIVSNGTLLRMPRLLLGNLIIERPSTGLSRDTQGAFGISALNDGTIGVPVWRRMRMIIDYSRSRVILEPQERLDEPDAVDASGLALVTSNQPVPALRVAYVIEGSPAAAAGLRVDDELLSIDGQPTSPLALDRARELLRSSGTTRKLALRRDGKSFDVALALHEIF